MATAHGVCLLLFGHDVRLWYHDHKINCIGIQNMAFIQQIAVEDATGKLRQIYDAGIRRAGSVANIIKIMSLDADSCNASMMFYVSMMKRENALDAATREMLATVVSNVNDCYY